jgi:DegV family protein with EDD domain
MSIKIITVSSSDITQKLAKKLGIVVIPHQVAFGTESFSDGVDLLPEEFYRRLESAPVFPTTSAVTTGTFAEAYNRLAEETDEILCIVLSSGLSVTCEAAVQAKKMVKNKDCRIEVIETLGVAGGTGLLVLDAAMAARAGESLDSIVEMTKGNIPRSHVRIALDTLNYLYKGGRIGKAQALAGSILRIKPIIEARGGFLPIGRERSHKRVMQHLYNYIRSFKKIYSLALQYTNNKADVEELANRVSSFFPRNQIHIWPLTPVCGAHAGPRSVVVSVIGDR